MGPRVGRQARARWGALAAIIVAAGALQLLGAPPSQAEDGTILRTITAQNYACSVGTGIAFDGSDLLLSCNYDNVITAVSPADGSFVTNYEITGVSAIGAIAWDSARGELWACGGFGGDDTIVYRINLATQTATMAFDGDTGCPDGLAYDGTNDTLWLSPDVSPTIYHYSTTGTLLGTYPANLGSCGNSGIAVGGPYLFLANNGCSEIYRAGKSDPAVTELFGSYPARLEDLECDDITFQASGKAAIWSKDAYDGILNAFELNPGDCGFGGQPTGGGNGDRDGDGLPDTWEENGLRAEAGLILVDLPAMGADPDRPDIFLRLDATSGSHVHPRAEQIVIDAFAEQGIALHIEHGPDIPEDVARSWRVEDSQDSDDKIDTADWDAMYDYWTNGRSWLGSIYHYGAMVRWNAEWSGQAADIGSQQMAIAVCGERNWRGGCKASVDRQAVALMHELGHQLGLRHGGSDGIAYKPNYLSIMNYAYSVNHDGIPGIGITYSSWGEDDVNILDESSLSEFDGILDYTNSVPDGTRIYYYCPASGRERYGDVGGPIDWDCHNGIDAGRITANIDFPSWTRQGDQAVYTILRPYDDWANIDYRGGGNIGSPSPTWTPGVPIA